MKLAFIGQGGVPIPPPGWGAVEDILWRRACRLRALGHTVEIYNTKRIDEAIDAINRSTYDFVHLHADSYAEVFNERLTGPYALTSHHGGLQRIADEHREHEEGFYRPRFEASLRAPANLALSPDIAELYIRNGYRGFLQVLPNTVDTEAFRFSPRGTRDAICLGRIGGRKRQSWLAQRTSGQVAIDFVGPWHPARTPEFTDNVTAPSRYLGPWDRATVCETLTEYRCLVLLSKSEAAPLVVLEALAAGLSVVVSDACTANLPGLGQGGTEFITVLPVAEARRDVIVDAIRAAIDGNDRLRSQAREYARAHFDDAVGIEHYLRLIAELRAPSTLAEAFVANGWGAARRELASSGVGGDS